MLKYLESFILAAAALFLLLVFSLALHIDLLNFLHCSRVWAKSRHVIQNTILLYGILFSAAAAISFVFAKHHNNTLGKCCYLSLRAAIYEIKDLGSICERNDWLWLSVITGLGALLRCFFLAQPMGYDESVTFLRFANRGITHVFFYPLPNNHVLHTLLVKLSADLFGADPAAIRLPAFIFSVLSIPLAFIAAKCIYPKLGYFSAAMMAIYPYVVLYGTRARGYSLLIFLTLCLVALGARMASEFSAARTVLLAIVMALGFFDMPSFLFPALGLVFWITAISLINVSARQIITQFWLPCGAIALLLTVIFYTPVSIASNGVERVINNPIVRGMPLDRFLQSLPLHTFTSCGVMIDGVPPLLAGLLALLLAVALAVMFVKRQWVLFSLLPLVLLGGLVALFAKHAIPFARTWIYLLPIAFLCMDYGAVILRIHRNVLAAAACISGIMLMNYDVVSRYDDGGIFPEAPVVAAYLGTQLTPSDHVSAECPADFPLAFYLWKRGYVDTVNGEGRTFIVKRQKSNGENIAFSYHDVEIFCEPAGRATGPQ